MSLGSALLLYSYSLSAFSPGRPKPPIQIANSPGSRLKPKMLWPRVIPRARPTASAGPRCWPPNSTSSLTQPGRPTESWSICFEHRNRCIAPWPCFNRAESELRPPPGFALYSLKVGSMPSGHWRTIPPRPRTRPFMTTFINKPRNGWRLFRNCNRNGLAGRRYSRSTHNYADFFCASKYSRVTLKTIGDSNNKPTRLGIAIKPLRVSDKFQTKSTFTLAKPNAAATHNTR